jgi:uncharacterized membrane protein
LESKSDEKYWEKLKELETALTSRIDYSQNQQFQRLIARYQIFLGLAITLVAFFLGYGNYYLAGFFAALAFIIYWRYEREWDKSKQDTVKLWEKRDQKEIDTEIKRMRGSKKVGENHKLPKKDRNWLNRSRRAQLAIE